MEPRGMDTAFTGSVPQRYQRYMVPMIFEPYAVEMARRVAAREPTRVLEVAAGTGVVTRHLADLLPEPVGIIGTDLNPAMLEQAAKEGTSRPVTWQQADAQHLPFPDASFDVVVCQFGAMFFPDRPGAYAEVRRVLRPGGTFLLSVWDRIEDNAFADTISRTLADMFPEDPPRFMEQTPHGYHDPIVITRDLAVGGFAHRPDIATVSARSVAPSPRFVAVAYCEGTPWGGEIEARQPGVVPEAVDRAEAAIAREFGTGAVDGKIQALMVAVDV
ncbi:MAG: class I SAM-dependent methyltransferase [Thermomicrobiales bacterium]